MESPEYPGRFRRAFGFLFGASLVYYLVLSTGVGFEKALLLSTGALWTFGARSELLQDLPGIYTVIYVSESFIGVALMALWITTLDTRWFREQQ